MRILIAATNRTVEGGAETYQHALIRELLAAGHHAALLHERPATPGRSTVDGDAHGIPAWCAAHMGTKVVVEYVAKWSPDVVYLQGLPSPALEARVLDRWPCVLFAHDYYGTCETGTKRHAFPSVSMCTRTFGPTCLALHYPRRCGGLNPVTMLRTYRLQAARHALLARYRTICVASAHMRSEYLRHRLPQDRLHVLPLPPAGIARDAAPPAPRPPGNHVVMAGRLTNLKGGDLLVDALQPASHLLGRPLSLTVMGDGPERGRLESRARLRGVTARFVGWASVAERNRMLRTADVLAIPSVWPEPWGLVGLEAARAGVPAVAFATGGIPEWLVPGETGELAPAAPPTPAGLAAAIARALGDPEHYSHLCHGAWVRAGQYTMERHMDELLGVLARAGGGSRE